MRPSRVPVASALLALALALAARVATAQNQGITVSESEAQDPPTRARLRAIEDAAAESGWESVARPLRDSALRSYGQNRLIAAEAWFHLYQWALLFSEPEDRCFANWAHALQVSQLNYPGVIPENYSPSNRPIGVNLSPEMKDWVLSNEAFSEEFFSGLRPQDNLPAVFAILEGLHRRDGARFARYSSLALAIALVYDVPPPTWWPHNQVTPEALSRKLPNPAVPFDWLTREDMLGHTYHRLSRLRAEELKFVVDAAAPIPELVWAQEAVVCPLDSFEEAYKMVKYRTDRVESAPPRLTWAGMPYTLDTILSEGGICVDQAYFASEAGKARGIPTLLFTGTAHDGYHAWFGFLDAENAWRLDAGRYAEQRLVTGTAIDPQTWGPISDHELQFLSERFRALPSFMESRVNEEFAVDFLLTGSPALAARSARTAVNYERRNLPAWETLIAANARLGLDPASQEGVLREAARAFVRYPDLVVWYKNRVGQSLRARGETSLADFEERSVAESEKGERSDLAIQQAAAMLSRSIARQPIGDQIATYNAILVQFGHGEGTMFFDEIVAAFAEHLVQVRMKAQAREAVERARQVLEIQPGTQLAADADKLAAKLQD
ncbi:MAG TPA: hypothetical protein VN775_10825 [Opitutaceae bacterium]|nr:hypothetical protein [Opitutaceae bacterium]